MRRFKLEVFASHNRSNLQSIIDESKQANFNADIEVVINNNSKSAAPQRAKREDMSNYS